MNVDLIIGVCHFDDYSLLFDDYSLLKENPYGVNGYGIALWLLKESSYGALICYPDRGFLFIAYGAFMMVTPIGVFFS